jgi:hypothetical protein
VAGAVIRFQSHGPIRELFVSYAGLSGINGSMGRMRSYRYLPATPVPTGSIIVRIVDSGGEPRATVRQKEEGTEIGDIHPSELMPVDVALRLAESRRENQPGAEIFIELESGVDWDDAWGERPGR